MEREVGTEDSVVFVIDDDPFVRQSLEHLLRSIGLTAKVFASPDEFMAELIPPTPCCLILDVRLPHQGGLEVQAKLSNAHVDIPIIFISAFADIPMVTRAMKAGAIEFLTKPVRDQDLVDAVQVALNRDKAKKDKMKSMALLWIRYHALTQREVEVMKLVTSGLMNKQVAGVLGLSEVTVKIHRANVMKKMEASSLAELVKMADIIYVSSDKHGQITFADDDLMDTGTGL